MCVRRYEQNRVILLPPSNRTCEGFRFISDPSHGLAGEVLRIGVFIFPRLDLIRGGAFIAFPDEKVVKRWGRCWLVIGMNGGGARY